MPYLLFINFSSSNDITDGYIVGIVLPDRLKIILGSVPDNFTYSVSKNYILALSSNISWDIPVIVLGRTQVTN